MAFRKDIENTRQTIGGLRKMAVELGYNNGYSGIDPIVQYLEDNPGAIEAVINFALEAGIDRDHNPLEDNEDEDDEE